MRIKSILTITARLAWTIAGGTLAHLIARYMWANSVRTQGRCKTYNYEPGVAITVGNFHGCEPGLLKENAFWYNYCNLPGITTTEFVLINLAAIALLMFVAAMGYILWLKKRGQLNP